MTWSARITLHDGTTPTQLGATVPDYSACQTCRHNTGACQVAKVAHNVGSILTSVDVGCDGHMASGEALLKCNGYQPKE